MLLNPDVWAGKIFSGEWAAGSAGEYDAVEPATGAILGRGGGARAAAGHHAAARAPPAPRSSSRPTGMSWRPG